MARLPIRAAAAAAGLTTADIGVTVDPLDATHEVADIPARDLLPGPHDLNDTVWVLDNDGAGNPAGYWWNGTTWRPSGSAAATDLPVVYPAAGSTLEMDRTSHVGNGTYNPPPVTVGQQFAVIPVDVPAVITGLATITDTADIGKFFHWTAAGDGSVWFPTSAASSVATTTDWVVPYADTTAMGNDSANQSEGVIAEVLDGSRYVHNGDTVGDPWSLLRAVTPPTSPLWQPATAYLTGDTVTATDPVDGLLHRYISLSDRTSGATFDATEEAEWQDTGATTGFVGATPATDGAQGEVPQPVAGQDRHSLIGVGAWQLRNRLLPTPVATLADIATIDPDTIDLGDMVFVENGGTQQRGAIYQWFRNGTAPANLSNWMIIGEITTIPRWDSNVSRFDSNSPTWDQNA